MIASQRKAHKIIWILLTVFMVILLLLNIQNLDFSKPSKVVPKEQVVATLENDRVLITVKTPLKSTSSLVYELTENGTTGKLLGKLDQVGSYSFDTTPTTRGIVIMDKIKNEELYKTTF